MSSSEKSQHTTYIGLALTMCRQETTKFACGHTEIGFLFECPIEHKRMRNHKFTQTATLKTSLVCFACDIPNMHPKNLREARRQIQLEALARQRWEMENAADNGSIVWTPDLLVARKRREELELAEKRERKMEKEFRLAEEHKMTMKDATKMVRQAEESDE